jgi:transposase
MKGNGHERQRDHALLLVHQGDSYREVAEILLVDEETVGWWVRQYQEQGVGGLRNHEQWGGEHGQRE